jgi:AbrB family looped-hinge helix DNA binding protein
MKTITRIDSAGRLVIPKELRKRYGFESGQRIRIFPGAEGVTLVPERGNRRFIKCGPIREICAVTFFNRPPGDPGRGEDTGCPFMNCVY